MNCFKLTLLCSRNKATLRFAPANDSTGVGVPITMEAAWKHNHDGRWLMRFEISVVVMKEYKIFETTEDELRLALKKGCSHYSM